MPDRMEENGAEASDAHSDNDEGSDTYPTDQEKMTEHHPSGEVKKKADSKDPNRTKRKKARRACFACQRAHLTCGDERPCKRCVKRGLAEACQDGVRKKAKYLHDAPPEALRPVLGPTWDPSTGTNRPTAQRQNSSASDNAMSTPSTTFFTPSNAPSYPVYSTAAQSGSVGVPESISFNPQASPVSPSFQGNPGNSQPPMGPMLNPGTMDFNALFDPSNPALYNFDLEGLNFGSQYAGWEFGILNKMTIGAETPPRENSLSQTPTNEPGYAAVFGNGGGYEPNSLMNDFSGGDRSMYSQGNLQHGLPHAYAIAAGPTSLASPSTEATSSPQPGVNIDGSPKPGVFGSVTAVSAVPKVKSKHFRTGGSILNKTKRDSARIYESVKDPYNYTDGFHKMIATLRSRLPLNKLLKIAMALGEIRPSFIACTKDLTREDLVFMEKCFQRTLVEFDDFLQHCAAPTVVCRRSGEVVAVNKEFTALTGWTKDVLLGKEPNKNIYIPTATAPASNDGSGTTTPHSKKPTSDVNPDKPQPVFLAELMDEDTAVDFYRDYSSLAFEDSRGKVQRSGRMMKYRTQEMIDAKAGPVSQQRTGGILSNRVTRIDGDMGISQIERDGKVHCTYCWTIKRDVFDIPMMIIINFLPRFYPNEEPQAV